METQGASQPPERTGNSLAVCLSGGGHRATLFALGTLMYLVDAGANQRVTSIASVSGGSLTNGFVGQALDFRSASSDAFRQGVARPLGTRIAKLGTLFAPLLSKLYLVVLIVGGCLVLAAPVAVPGAWYFRLFGVLLGLAVWGWIFGLRGRVCAYAFEKTMFSSDGHATPLSAVKKKELDHVICATDLRSSEQVFFSGDFVYSYQLGHGVPADLALAKAVQASAAFPGGFPPAHLPTRRHDFTGAPSGGNGPKKPPTHMVMSDGGVYDNMGDQWARGFQDRVARWRDLGKGRRPPDQLVVVNASARVPWQRFGAGMIPLFSDIALLVRVLNVMYINTTNVRRQDIVSSYNPGRPEGTSGLAGALVQISQSPFTVADKFARATGPVGERAREVINMLGPENRDKWAEIAEENTNVPTSLNALGVEVSARLIRQGFVVAMTNLYVIFGGEFPLLPDEVAAERFRSLIS